MIRTESDRMITKNIDDMTRAEYMEYKAEMRSLENIPQPNKLKTNDYFPSIPPCFKPAQPRTDDIHDPLGNKPNDYHLFTPQSHYKTKEVRSDEDVDEWLNEELSKRITREDNEEEEDALIDILKTVVEEYKSVYKKAQIRTPSSGTSEIQGVSFVSKEEGGDSSETLPYQQPSNEINPGSFTLPCTIGNLKIYVMADVGARINMMPKSLFEHLKLANLKKTDMAIEMGNMTNKAPLGIVENILIKIDKFLFHSNFVVINALEIILLGRPFLATIHPQLDVFRGEVSLGVGNEKVKFDMNGEICHSRVHLEKIYMVSSIQESKYVNPHEIENDDSPALGQRTFHYSEESVDTVDSSSDSQENEVGSHLSEIVSRWHVCKPVHITFKVCEEDCTIWPTCNPDLSFCSGYDTIYGKEENGMLKQWICFRDHERHNVGGNGMKFDDFLKVSYGNKNIDDVTRERRYYEWVAQNYDFKVKSQRTTKYTGPYDLHHKSDSPPNDTLRLNTYFPNVSHTQPKSRIRENSFEEWMKIKLEHINISDSMRCVMFKEWVKVAYNFEVNIGRTKDDPYSRNFDVYKDEFDKEIEQLVNEYELKARGRDMLWKKYGKNVKNSMIQPNSGMMKDLRKRNFGKME
ncbi:phospholipase-like protein [Tanacetum coccineum]|uniref:Phospholipase-like protein n=1 Tax=Tanacetum coccineum TaxID=301880 RepID=A0ABQ5BM07_9ASTR